MSYSFIRFLVFFEFCYLCFSVNDIPGGNFLLQYPEYPGKCPKLPKADSTSSKSMIEGRWHIIQENFTPEKAQNLNCLTWDLYFDRKGALHNFESVFENGELKTKNTRLTPLFNNVYIVKLGRESKLHAIFMSTFYYMNQDCFIYIEIGCKKNGNHYRNLVVGIRNLIAIDHVSHLINASIKKLDHGKRIQYGKADLRHTNNCRDTLAPAMTNPYTKLP